ncbi:uncharacterized protein PRCAT00001213001 [Priceomyces carsonii]|uniref:uncharacterized protein n=1 Tax=Priceomyces carsonii TaxID=28549 RepID=UPI002ED79E10|nr:unnamed protein product [Priceomyces carsonii]
MSFWDLRLYTHNVRIYVVVAILIWFLYIYVFPAPFLKEEWIPLNKLPVYEKLPQCFDTTDGIECFRRYRPELVKQSKRVLSTESYTNFER